MYKEKYYKYKAKYLQLKNSMGGEYTYTIEDTNNIGSNIQSDEEFVKDDIISTYTDIHSTQPYIAKTEEIDDLMTPIESPDTMESTETMEPTVSKEQLDESENTHIYDSEFLGKVIEGENISEVPNDYVSKYGVDVSFVRGSPANEYELDPNDIILINDKYEPNMILKLNTDDDFDDFTEKYAQIIDMEDLKVISIKWNEVAKKYKGLFINRGLEESRKTDCFYQDKTYPSWWGNEFRFDNIVLFIK